MIALLILIIVATFLFGVITGFPVANIVLGGIVLVIVLATLKSLLFRNRVKKDAQFDSKYNKHYHRYRKKYDK